MGNLKAGITGADGFVAGFLKKKLEDAGIEYEGIDFEDYKKSGFNDLVKDKDCIFHLAGVNRSENEEDYIQGNLELTKELITAIKEHGKEDCKIVFASSTQVYGDIVGEIDELTPPKPLWIYATTKLNAEKAIAESGLEYANLRVSNVYGPRGRPFYNSVVATFLHLIKEGKPLTVNGTGEQTRDYVFVEDVAQAMVEAIMFEDGTYLVSTNQLTSINQIINIVGEILGKDIEVIKKETDETITETRFNNSKILKTGWKPKYDIKEGLKKCLSEN